MRNCCGLEVGRMRWEAIVDYVGAYGPHENPRGNFVERSSISCVQWDIGIKRMVRESRICFCIFWIRFCLSGIISCYICNFFWSSVDVGDSSFCNSCVTIRNIVSSICLIKKRMYNIYVYTYEISDFNEYIIASLLEIYYLIFLYFLGLNWVNALIKLQYISKY